VNEDRYRVRRAVAEDWPISRAIRLLALAEAPLAFASTLERETAFGPDQWRQRIAGAAQFLAETGDGEVVGTATGFDDPDEAGTVLLVAMFVAATARGTGLADRLVWAVVDQARADGAGRVRLHVVETNAVAERLYTRSGFVHTGTTVPLPHRPELLEHEMVLDLTGDHPARRERPRSEAPGSVGIEESADRPAPSVLDEGSQGQPARGGAASDDNTVGGAH
jgi:GNAT superfamily N-acetyltransferase